MNVRTPTWRRRTVACLCLAFVTGTVSIATAAGGTGTNAPAKSTNEVAKSVFIMPRNKNEGRDPFHPASSHAWVDSQPTAGTHAPAPTVDLQLKAIGGTPDHRIATINTRNFAKGEDGEMNTTSGRIQIHIVDILDDAVVLTVNGEQRELRFRRQFQ